MSLITKVIVDRLEGLARQCGPRSFEADAAKGVDPVHEADKCLLEIAKTGPPMGYDKVQVTIEFEEGDPIVSRHDVGRWDPDGSITRHAKDWLFHQATQGADATIRRWARDAFIRLVDGVLRSAGQQVTGEYRAELLLRLRPVGTS